MAIAAAFAGASVSVYRGVPSGLGLLFSVIAGVLAGPLAGVLVALAGGVGFATNFVLWREAGYFNAASEGKPFLHLWSLAIEEQFYLVFPALMLLIRGSNRRRLVILISLFGLFPSPT